MRLENQSQQFQTQESFSRMNTHIEQFVELVDQNIEHDKDNGIEIGNELSNVKLISRL